MSSVPTLTIGLPVYNGASFLDAAVESVLAQSFGDFELVLSDNASTDGTEAIGRQLAALDPRVTYRRNAANIGLRANFNLLPRLARGRLFKWAASDDMLRPGYLARCVQILDGDPSVVLACSGADFVDGGGALLDIQDPGWNVDSADPANRLARAIAADHYVNAMLGILRTDALRRTRLLPSYPGGDYRLMAELALLGRFVEIPERLLVRRVHEGSSKSNAEDARWMRRYWNGTRTGGRAANWRLARDRALITLSAPIPWSERVAILRRLGRTMVSNRTRLVRELAELVRP